MSDIDKSKLYSWFETNRDSIINTIQEVFNQKKVEIETTPLDDQNLADQAISEDFPCVGIQFFSSEDSSHLQHLITIDTDTALNLYSWMSEEKMEKTFSEEQWVKFHDGLEEFLQKVSDSVDEETMRFTFQNLTVSQFESGDEFLKILPLESGLSASHKFMFGKNIVAVKQYSWSKSISDDDFVDVSRAEFDSFTSESDRNGSPRNIDMLLDVELEVLVELGRKSMKIRDVLKLGKGSLIELNKTAGEPLTIYVNNRKLAEGEVVVIDDNFGIRITKLASPKERIKSLG